MNCFSHLFTLQFTQPFVIVCFEVFQREIRRMVPFCKLIYITFLSFTEMGMGIRVVGTVGDGFKYLSPCSSLLSVSHYSDSSVRDINLRHYYD